MVLLHKKSKKPKSLDIHTLRLAKYAVKQSLPKIHHDKNITKSDIHLFNTTFNSILKDTGPFVINNQSDEHFYSLCLEKDGLIYQEETTDSMILMIYFLEDGSFFINDKFVNNFELVASFMAIVKHIFSTIDEDNETIDSIYDS